METIKQRLGEIRKDFEKEPLSETFKMMDSDLELKVTIIYHVSIILNQPSYSCSAHFELYRKTGNSVSDKPFIQVTGHAPSTDEISNDVINDVALAYFSLSGSRMHGFKLRFAQIDIESIHFSEGQRLLAFFKNMYGIKIVYEADIFSFLGKSEKDAKEYFPLPYPKYELN